MITIHEAIYKLNPSVVQIEGDIAYDKDRNIVDYDKKAAQLEFEKSIKEQQDAKKSAIDKLTSLGLTADQIAVLGVK